MTTLQDLRTSISSLLTTCGYPGPFILQNNAADAAFEAYVFTLVLRAFTKLGAQVELRSINSPNSIPSVFCFRGSPGFIYSRSADFGYAYVRYQGNDLEVHIDVQHRGSSGVLHELDVSIISSEEGRRCRRASTQAHPKSQGTDAAIECKFYTTSLKKSLIREFVGVATDLGRIHIYRFVTSGGSVAITQYCTGPNRRPYFTGTLSPLDPNGERDFIAHIAEDIRKWLG